MSQDHCCLSCRNAGDCTSGWAAWGHQSCLLEWDGLQLSEHHYALGSLQKMVKSLYRGVTTIEAEERRLVPPHYIFPTFTVGLYGFSLERPAADVFYVLYCVCLPVTHFPQEITLELQHPFMVHIFYTFI